jgi:hypothetical protein
MQEKGLAPPSILRTVVLSGLIVFWGAPARSLRAEPQAEGTIYQSLELRIYRVVDRYGAPTVVLTNLDEEGNRLGGEPQGAPCAPSAPPEASRAATTGDAPGSHPGLHVSVHGPGGAEAPEGAGSVEITGDGHGETTVVININNLPPPPAVPAPEPQAIYPVFAVGGLAGPFRYPDHQYFLGYGPGVSSPSLFSGLGLNAGNRFGLKTGRACGQGYDCLFAP